MDKRETKLNRAIAQVLEWTYGSTNIEFEIECIRYKRVGGESPDHHISYQAVTDVRRVSHWKHPGALAFESIGLSLTGIAIDGYGRLQAHIMPGDTDKIAEFDKILEENNLDLLSDNGGFGIVNVQILMYSPDGAQRSVSRAFVYRNNQLNHIR